MHYLLHYLSYETGIKLVGICTMLMLMLLAVVTGVITHKRIFTDFFTFRPGKGQRSWLGAHNVVSVMSLPFFLMITYTGLVFFAITYLPAARDALYGDTPAQRQAYVQELRGPVHDDLPVSAPRVPLPALVARLEAEWNGRVASLQMVHPRNAPPLHRRAPGRRIGPSRRAAGAAAQCPRRHALGASGRRHDHAGAQHALRAA
ncbi:MAG: PepSY-associated TM helix domain-containing protein [Achromobacter veterisilvae]